MNALEEFKDWAAVPLELLQDALVSFERLGHKDAAIAQRLRRAIDQAPANLERFARRHDERARDEFRLNALDKLRKLKAGSLYRGFKWEPGDVESAPGLVFSLSSRDNARAVIDQAADAEGIGHVKS